jgi:hypothetical protein
LTAEVSRVIMEVVPAAADGAAMAAAVKTATMVEMENCMLMFVVVLLERRKMVE